MLPDQAVDLATRRAVGNQRAGNFGQTPHGSRKVAFVCNADKLIRQTELTHDLGGTRKQRDDSHGHIACY